MKLIEGSLCPLTPLRFLCDEMLINVAQWLRVAGYDTTLPAPGSPDGQLVDRSRAEQRWLVTADADLLEFVCAPFYVLYLSGGDDEARLKELTLRLDLDWCLAPFSRCKNCNTPLHTASEREKQLFRPRVRGVSNDAVRACATCRQLYWEGSHVRRMRRRLEAMNVWRDALRPPH